MPKPLKPNDQIFGYIEPHNGYINSKVIPYEYAKTYGDKNGISHLDVFGYLHGSSIHTWICHSDGMVSWHGEPDEEMKTAVSDHLFNRYGITTSKHESESSRSQAYKGEQSVMVNDASNSDQKTIITAQHIDKNDYPSVEDIAAYAESLKLCLEDGSIKDEELKKLVKNLPSPVNISKRLSLEEVKILFQTIGYVWKKLTGRSLIEDSKVEAKKETLCGNYWIIKKGIILEGTNHYSIIKQNLELFRSLLGISGFAMHEKLSLEPNAIIKLVLDHGGVRLFVSEDRRMYCQMTDTTYSEWAKNKIRKYDFNKKIVKVMDRSVPYKGWRSGLTVILH